MPDAVRPAPGSREGRGEEGRLRDTFIRLQLLGKLLIAENLRDALWSLELLTRQEQVDADRLGCVGLSYGGRMTMLAAALEPRIRVAVVSGALNVMQERIAQPFSCGAQIIPGLLNVGDVPEIAGLIAPRPCVWEVGNSDKLIAPRWADEALMRMRRVYKALGGRPAPDRSLRRRPRMERPAGVSAPGEGTSVRGPPYADFSPQRSQRTQRHENQLRKAQSTDRVEIQ